jgi:long-subunit acyl-CoA synthetase (AMP-forming)
LWPQIERVNRRLEHYEQIRKFVVLNEDFPSEVRSINVFQKIKVDRKALAERYRKEIDEIYSGASEGEGY